MAPPGFPALLPDPPVAENLEVLHALSRRRRALAERIGEARAVNRQLRHADEALPRLDAEALVQRRRDVDHVMELVADLAAARDAARPVRHQRRADSASVGVFLVTPQR